MRRRVGSASARKGAVQRSRRTFNHMVKYKVETRQVQGCFWNHRGLILFGKSYPVSFGLIWLGKEFALELMCRCRVNRVREVAIRFGLRAKGQSKLNLKEQFNYLQHLSRQYDFTFPRAAPILKFLIVLALGGVAAGGGFALGRWCGANLLVSVLVGYLVLVQRKTPVGQKS